MKKGAYAHEEIRKTKKEESHSTLGFSSAKDFYGNRSAFNIKSGVLIGHLLHVFVCCSVFGM